MCLKYSKHSVILKWKCIILTNKDANNIKYQINLIKKVKKTKKKIYFKYVFYKNNSTYIYETLRFYLL